MKNIYLPTLSMNWETKEKSFKQPFMINFQLQTTDFIFEIHSSRDQKYGSINVKSISLVSDTIF